MASYETPFPGMITVVLDPGGPRRYLYFENDQELSKFPILLEAAGKKDLKVQLEGCSHVYTTQTLTPNEWILDIRKVEWKP